MFDPPFNGDGTVANPLSLMGGGVTGNVLRWDGSQWGVGGAVQAEFPLLGNGNSMTPLALSPGNGLGEVLRWNGLQWTSDFPANVQAPLIGGGTPTNPIGLANGNNVGEVLRWDGTGWFPSLLPAGDNWGTQSVVGSAAFTGSGTLADPLELSPQGASTGQVLKWNGSSWAPGNDDTGSGGPDNDWLVSGANMSAIPGGNVGIGTINPVQKLDVVGNINIDTPSGYLIGDRRMLWTNDAADVHLGFNAGMNNPAAGNTFIGDRAGQSSWGDRNVYVGAGAGLQATFFTNGVNFAVSSNTAVGIQAMGGTATNNGWATCIGETAGRDVKNSLGFTLVGHGAGLMAQGATAGYILQVDPQFSIDPGLYVTVVGAKSGRVNNAPFNSFFGGWSGSSNTTGAFNTFLGQFTGTLNVTGNLNTYVGSQAGVVNTGSANTLVGARSGNGISTGNNNTYVGASTGKQINTLPAYNTPINSSGGNQNVFIGSQTGRSNEGNQNVFIGFRTGDANTTGSGNILIGSGANVSQANLSNAMAIGQNATVGQSNTLIIGRTGLSSTSVGIGTTTPSAQLQLVALTRNGVQIDETGNNNGLIVNETRNGTAAILSESHAGDGMYISETGQGAGISILEADAGHGLAIVEYNNGDGIRIDSKNGGDAIRIEGQRGILIWDTLSAPNNLASQNLGITTKGAVCIGMHNPVDVSGAQVGGGNVGPYTAQLSVNGAVYSSVGYYKPSDERMKRDFNSIENARELIQKMNPISYTYDATVSFSSTGKMAKTSDPHTVALQLPTSRQMGFKAQELKTILPEAVGGQDSTGWAIEYDMIIPVLVQAMKEDMSADRQQFQTLQQENRQLHNRVTQLEQRLNQLEQSLMKCCDARKSEQPEFPDDNIQDKQLPTLGQNAPNPFNKQTTIPYYLPATTQSARIVVMTVEGEIVHKAKLSQTGYGQEIISAHTLAIGTYIYQLIVDGKVVDSKRMMITN
ncbi:MAG: tail fiber domain-containing protein [Bacteroidetes bacterium]|nr:tail fiber domain-containing protein [Bacteroidota bacterium]